MSVLPQDYSRKINSEASVRKTSGPVAWGLAGGLIAFAAMLAASLAPAVVIAGVSVISVALLCRAGNDLSHDSTGDEPIESWEETAARIGTYAESLEPERDLEQRKFQAMILSQERASRQRLH